MELSISWPFNKPYFHEMFSTLSFAINPQVSHSPSVEVSPLYVIFDIIGVLLATCFEVIQNNFLTWHQRTPFYTFIMKLELKELFKRCIMQFILYFWSIAQHHNISNYLNKTWCETKITIDLFRILGQERCKQYIHFLLVNLNKFFFIKTLSFFF